MIEIEDIEAEALRLMGFSLIEYALADLKENKNTSIKICKQFLGDVHVEDISRRLLSFSENEKPIVSPRFGLDVRLKIDFTENAIGPNGVRDILALNNTNVFILTELNLSENPIGDKGVMAIANLLKGPACKLEILNLTCLQEAVTIYYPLLPRNQRKPNPLNISTESVNSLADALCVNTSLLELVMADNRIQGPAAKVLCEALKSNSTLSILDLSKNKIGWNGSRQILDMLKKAKDTLSFSQINLSFNDLGSNSIKYINKFNKQYPDNQIICNTPEAESIDFEERWNRDRHKSFTIGRFREI
uniref:Uncharacterized protein n=1 Tax=Aplanochytrium stocchinoi TaxID=215587 RepID=A0A7S3PQ84_9STRA|mmetsp:Transcript_4861/g.6152  ORF Transcript_4861/g.6152 Transcript_4861/m.6152 type:complete len:303 (+) Transcript_4861:84-992(+)